MCPHLPPVPSAVPSGSRRGRPAPHFAESSYSAGGTAPRSCPPQMAASGKPAPESPRPPHPGTSGSTPTDRAVPDSDSPAEAVSSPGLWNDRNRCSASGGRRGDSQGSPSPGYPLPDPAGSAGRSPAGGGTLWSAAPAGRRRGRSGFACRSPEPPGRSAHRSTGHGISCDPLQICGSAGPSGRLSG